MLQAEPGELVLIVPERDPSDSRPYPGNIRPGRYRRNDLVALLRRHRDSPETIQFIADMLEE